MNDLADALALLAADLPAAHVAAWARVLESSSGPSGALEAALIDARPGYGVTAKAATLVAAWRGRADLPGTAVALALRAAASVAARADARRTDVAISGPTTPSVPVRLTPEVVTEVIRHARETLLVVSFAAYGVPHVVTELVTAARRGVHVDLVLETTLAQGGTLRGSGAAPAPFADLRAVATLWHWPARRRTSTSGSRPALHAKLIAADHDTALISSANLTDRALADNLEVGVILRDPAVVDRIVRHFRALMDHTGPLERAGTVPT